MKGGRWIDGRGAWNGMEAAASPPLLTQISSSLTCPLRIHHPNPALISALAWVVVIRAVESLVRDCLIVFSPKSVSEYLNQTLGQMIGISTIKSMNKKDAPNTNSANSTQQQRSGAVKDNKDGIQEGGFPPAFGSPASSATALVSAAPKHQHITATSEYHDAKSGPLSPSTTASPLNRGALNPKAEALAEAHRGRVEAEAQAFLDSEIRKLEAKAHKLQAKAERQRMHEETKALEARKREETRADQLLHTAEAKANKILARAREDAHRIKAHASEQTEKAIADAYTRAERWKAEIEETKKKDLAEITDRVHTMVAIGELPSAQDHKGVVQRMKESWACHP